MVDEIITRQELIDAKRDARDLGKAVNEKVIVSPRYGEDFRSLPLIAEEFQISSDAAEAAAVAAVSAAQSANSSANIAEAAATAATISAGVFETPEAGVDPVTGVADGAYFNVRSSSDESYVDEYQNVGGVATATGKSYPSSKIVSHIQQYTALPYVTGKLYQLNERVQLANGDIVKSTIEGNTNNPNLSNMTGWIFDTNTVVSIADLLAIQNRKHGQTYNVLSYYSNLNYGGGDFVWDATSTATANNGTVFAVTGVVTGRWLRVLDGGDWWVEWFGPKKDGATDDSGIIRAAVAAAPDGGTLRFGVGDFLVLSPVRVAKLLNLYGSGMGTKMYIRDRMFVFGQPSSEGVPRFNAQPIIKDFFFTSQPGGMQGNIAAYYGDSAPTVGYLTRTTPAAGFKKSATENATNTAIVFEQIYAPCKISGCYFYEIGTGVKVGLNYGHIIENNRFLWCTIGIDVAGNSTTVDISKNTIERCALGVYVHYPAHHVFIDRNVIEANYGGCDILCWQNPDSIWINRNYFEASPECLVFGGVSSTYNTSKVHIEGNFSIRISIRGVAKNFRVVRNNLTHVNLTMLVGTTLSNIVFEDNYLRSDQTPFNPIYVDTGGGSFDGVRWNSVSEGFKHEVKFISSTRFIGAAQLDHTTDHMNTFIKTEANLIRTSSASISKAFEVVAPNEAFDAFLEVSSVKSSVDGTKSTRIVKHTVMIRRIKDQDTVVTVKLDSDVDIPSPDGLTISAANLTPSSQFTGTSTGQQRVSILTLNNDATTPTARWIIGVEMLCNRTDVSIIRGT